MRKTGIVFLYKQPILTSKQLDKLSDVFIACGQLTAASIVLPFVVPGLDTSRTTLILFGLGLTLAFWIASVVIVRRIK